MEYYSSPLHLLVQTRVDINTGQENVDACGAKVACTYARTACNARVWVRLESGAERDPDESGNFDVCCSQPEASYEYTSLK